MMEVLQEQVYEDLLPGIEIIIGRNGKHYIRSLLADFDENYMMKIFTRGDHAIAMTKVQGLITCIHKKFIRGCVRKCILMYHVLLSAV